LTILLQVVMSSCRMTWELDEGGFMDSIYKVIELVGTSPTSWEDAAKHAVETASKSLKDIRIGEVSNLDMKIEEGKVALYRAKVKISFKYQH